MDIGPGELIIVLVAILLLFGPSKLPGLARSMGQALHEFKSGQAEPFGDRTPDSGPASGEPATTEGPASTEA